MSHVLAQLNIAKLVTPIDSPELADFVANLDRINELADRAEGFVWRYVTVEGDPDERELFGDDMLVNMSVWNSVDTLRTYVYQSGHLEIMRRRKEWFRHMAEAYTVLWWVPRAHQPTLAEARGKLSTLREFGPTEQAFTFKSLFPAPHEERHGA